MLVVAQRLAVEAVRRECAGQIGTVVELLAGKRFSAVVKVLCHRQKGLFPGTRAQLGAIAVWWPRAYDDSFVGRVTDGRGRVAWRCVVRG